MKESMSFSSSQSKQLPQANDAQVLPATDTHKGPSENQVVSIAPPLPTPGDEESHELSADGTGKVEQTTKPQVRFILFMSSNTDTVTVAPPIFPGFLEASINPASLIMP